MYIKNKLFLKCLLDLAKLRLIFTTVYVSFCFIFCYVKDFFIKNNSGTLKFKTKIIKTYNNILIKKKNIYKTFLFESYQSLV